MLHKTESILLDAAWDHRRFLRLKNMKYELMLEWLFGSSDPFLLKLPREFSPMRMTKAIVRDSSPLAPSDLGTSTLSERYIGQTALPSETCETPRTL